MNGYAPLPPGFEMMEPPEGFELDEEQGAPPPPEGFEMAPLPAGFEMEQPRAALPAEDLSRYGIGAPEPEEETGYWSNKARGFGEQAVDIGADLLNMVGRAGEAIGEGAAELVIGDAEETKRLKKIVDKKKKEGTYDAPFNVAKVAADAWKERDFGYEQTASFQDVKDAEGVMDTITTGLEFALDTGVTSLPHMAAMMINMPAYLTSRTEALASDRAAANGRKEPIAEDFGWGGVTALAVTALDKIGLDKLLSFAKAGGGSVMKGMAKGAAQGTLTEGTTETAQEFIEYMGTHAGTEEGANMADAVDAALAGLIGGGPFGGVVGGAAGGVGAMRDGADARTALPTGEDVAGDETAEFTTPEQQVGTAEVAAARTAINPDPVVPGTAEADAEIARQMGEPPPAPAAVDQLQPGGAPLEPMAEEDIDQAETADAARLTGLLNEKYAAEAANEAEAAPAVAGAMQFQTPPQTPMMARTMEALAPALEKFNGQREMLTGGRKRKATPEMLADADMFWAMALQQANLLDSEGYNTAALRQVLRKAAGNKPATEKTLSDRENRPVTARFRGDIDTATGQPLTHRAPRGGGWGPRLENMYAGIFAELNKLTQQGPTKTPKATKAAPVKTTTGSAPMAAAEPAAPVVEEAGTEQVPVEQPAPAPEKVKSVTTMPMAEGMEEAAAGTALTPEEQMIAEEEGEVEAPQLTNNERLRRIIEEKKQEKADAEKKAKVEEARVAAEAQKETKPKDVATVEVSKKGERLKRSRPKTMAQKIKEQPAGEKGKLGLKKKPVEAAKPAPKAPAKKPLPKQVGPQKKDKFASQPARDHAAKQGVKESEVKGTGAKGKITKKDVDRVVAQKRAAAESAAFTAESKGVSERQNRARRGKTNTNGGPEIRLTDKNVGMSQALKDNKLPMGGRDVLTGNPQAVVSPANSFGHMNGGIDLVYMKRFGDQIESRVKNEIEARYGGEMPIGEAFVIRTQPDGVPIPKGDPEFLVVSPTMVRPGALKDGSTVYQATLAALKAADEAGIDRMNIPGMGTGVGKLAPKQAAEAMTLAIEDFMAIKDGELTYEQALNDYVGADGRTLGDTTPSDIDRIKGELKAYTRELIAEMGPDAVFMYHGTNKGATDAVVASPRANQTQYGAAGTFAASDMDNAIDWAARKFGADNVGVGVWAFTKADFDKMQKNGMVRKGTMSIGESIKNYGDTEKTFEEYVLTPKALEFIYDERAIKDEKDSAETSAVALEDNPAREDILASRELAADSMDMALEGGPVVAIDLLNHIQRQLDPADPFNVLINKLRATGVGEFNVEMIDVGDMIDEAGGSAGGLYKSFKDELGRPTREILINERVSGTAHGVKVLLHEMVHAATAEGMTTNNQLAQEMESIRKKVMAHLEAVGDRDALAAYGFTNVDEFVAEALSSEAFQRILAGVTTGKDSNLWRDLLRAISEFLGLPVENSSALAEVMNFAPDLFMSDQQSLDAMTSGRRKFVSTVEEDMDMNNMTKEELDALMGKPDLTPDAARGQTVNTARRLGDNTVADVTGKMYDALKGTAKIEALRTAKRIGLGFQTLDQIVRNNKAGFQAGAKNALRAYTNVMRKKTQYAREAQQTAEALNEKWKKFEQRTNEAKTKVLGKFMHDATMSGIHPDKAFNDPANAHLKDVKGALAQWKLMNKRFNELPAGGRQLYREASNFFNKQRNDMRRSSLKHMARTWSLDNPSVMSPVDYQKVLRARTPEEVRAINFGMLGDNAQQVEDSLAQIADLTSVQGPYFPLRRFGKYVVEGVREGEKVGKTHAKRKDAWEAARIARNLAPDAKIRTRRDAAGNYFNEKVSRTVEMFETNAEAEARAAELQAQGYTGRGGGGMAPSLKEDWNMPPGTAAGTLLTQAKRKFDDDSPQAKALDTAFIELLLENSVRKSELQRKKVSGATFDMRRAFAERAQAGSWGIADIETSLDHHKAIVDMRKQARQNVKLGEVVQEIELRDKKALSDRKISLLDEKLSKFGFLNYLASPSYTMVNLTQVPLVAAPYLTAKYGPKAMVSLARSYRGVAKAGGEALVAVKGGLTGEAPVDALDRVISQLDGYDPAGKHTGEAGAIQKLTDQGIIDATFMQELYSASKGKEGGRIKRGTDYLMNVARTTPQIAEIINRVVVARTAYDLEMKKSGDNDLAVEAASEAVLQTQFDYTNENKPRYFKAFPGARAIMMFKMYTQGMYSLIIGSALGVMKGNKRAESAKMLGGLIASHSLAGGVLGGVFMEPVRAMISIAALIFEDDDAPWDVDDMVTKAIYDMTESAYATELLTRGVPRAAGVDLAGRVGLDNMILMGMSDSRSWQEWYSKFIIALGGPVIAAGGNVARGVDYLKKGDIRRGIEAGSPKFVRDALKTWRIADEGLLDYNGNVIAGKQNFGVGDYISQGLGIQPASSARMYESRTSMKSKETKMRDRRKLLMQTWRRKDPKARTAYYRDTIVPFSRKNPDFKVGIGQLLKSLTEQRRREAGTKGGAFTQKQQISKMKERYGY